MVPLYNEGARVTPLLANLRRVRGLGEVVLVDASDEPKSLKIIDGLAAQIDGERGNDPFFVLVRDAPRGRAVQMNIGARRSRGAVLLFLHCDTRLSRDAAAHITRRINRGRVWGWFDLRLDGRQAIYRLVERMINLRARTFRIATGDQAMFVDRRVFKQSGGFAKIPLMEDVELSRRLKKIAPPAIIAKSPVLTSVRRWRQNGITRTIFLMWSLRLRFWLGDNPARLAAVYRDVR